VLYIYIWHLAGTYWSNMMISEDFSPSKFVTLAHTIFLILKTPLYESQLIFFCHQEAERLAFAIE
jgi:hypothetical protein